MNVIKYNMPVDLELLRRQFRIFQAKTDLIQISIAAAIGCSQPHLSQILYGTRSNTTIMERLIHLITAPQSQQVN